MRSPVAPERGGRWPPRAVVRGTRGLRTYEAVLYRAGLGPVAGVDEAGRGACAGPLVVAACVLGPRLHPDLAGLDDSKRLTPGTRERLYSAITRVASAYSVVFIDPREIDSGGVHAANIAGMRRSAAALYPPAGYVLMDGFAAAGTGAPSLSMIGGDGVSVSIAAASILAKVSRDRAMVELDAEYPGYGFAGHKGYATAAHRAALESLGPSRVHRFSYANVAASAGGRQHGAGR